MKNQRELDYEENWNERQKHVNARGVIISLAFVALIAWAGVKIVDNVYANANIEGFAAMWLACKSILVLLGVIAFWGFIHDGVNKLNH